MPVVRRVIAAVTLFGFLFLGTFQSVYAAEPADPSLSSHFSADAATAAYLDTMKPEERARSDAYFEGGYWLQLWDFLIGLGVAWALLAWRISARMRDFAARLSRSRSLQTALYAVQYFV